MSSTQRTCWTRGIREKEPCTSRAWPSISYPHPRLEPCVIHVSTGTDSDLSFCWPLLVSNFFINTILTAFKATKFSFHWFKKKKSMFLFVYDCETWCVVVSIQDSSSFMVRVHACPPPGFFKPSRFHPQRNNIRTEWYTGLQTAQSGKACSSDIIHQFFSDNDHMGVLEISLSKPLSFLVCYRQQWTTHSTLQQLCSGGFTAQGSPPVSFCCRLPLLSFFRRRGFAQSLASSERARPGKWLIWLFHRAWVPFVFFWPCLSLSYRALVVLMASWLQCCWPIC